MRENYSNLCVLNLGKHCYSIMKSNDKVMYFESVNGKYVMPITNFNLYDNQGKSLTLVNQHFFMNQLINRINIALKKGYFSNDDDIVNYLNELKKNSENDSNLMNLFKGSLMGEINEDNFENNKREILKYLDKFRFDTFVNYNNVSIFSGSLEKNDDSVSQVVETVSSLDIDENASNEDSIEELDISSDLEPNVLEETIVSDTSDIVQEVSDNNVSQVSNNNAFDFMSVNSNDSSEFVNSNDYFGSLGNSNSQVQNTTEVLSGMSSNDYFSQAGETNIQPQPVVEQVDNVSDNMGNVVTNDQVVANDFNTLDNNVASDSVQAVEEQSSVNDTVGAPISDIQPVISAAPQLLENPSFVGNTDSSDPFSLSNTLDSQQNSNISYIDEVKDRLNAGNTDSSDLNQSQFNSEMGSESLGFSPSNLTLGDSVISDTNELPELEKISSAPIEEKVVDKTDKKSHLGVIIFMILLVIALGALSFYLYNYVF